MTFSRGTIFDIARVHSRKFKPRLICMKEKTPVHMKFHQIKICFSLIFMYFCTFLYVCNMVWGVLAHPQLNLPVSEKETHCGGNIVTSYLIDEINVIGDQWLEWLLSMTHGGLLELLWCCKTEILDLWMIMLPHLSCTYLSNR